MKYLLVIMMFVSGCALPEYNQGCRDGLRSAWHEWAAGHAPDHGGFARDRGSDA